MKQANKWRKYELDTNLCWALQLMTGSDHHRSVSSPPLPSYEESLGQLYGNISKVFDYDV